MAFSYKPVSFAAPKTGIEGSSDPADMIALQQQQALADALQQQASAIQYDPHGRIGWTQGLAQMLQSYEAGKHRQNVQDIANRIQTRQQQGLAGQERALAAGPTQIAGIGDQAPTPINAQSLDDNGNPVAPFDSQKYQAIHDAMAPLPVGDASKILGQALLNKVNPGPDKYISAGGGRIFDTTMGQMIGDAPQHWERKTRVLGNNMAQDYDFNPATRQEVKVGDPYKAKDPSAAVIAMQGGGNLSPNALDDAAERYRATGQLPALGMGAAAASARIKIMNRAAERAAQMGDTASAATIRQQVNKAGQSALAQITKQESVTGAFEKTAEQNLDLALQMSGEYSRTNSPLLNVAYNAFQKGVKGDPAASKFINALTAARNEYAKVLSSATGAQGITDAARKEAEDLFSKATSHQALVETVALAKKEMANRMAGFKQQRTDLLPQISATDATGGAAAPSMPTATNAQGNKIQWNGSAWVAVPK